MKPVQVQFLDNLLRIKVGKYYSLTLENKILGFSFIEFVAVISWNQQQLTSFADHQPYTHELTFNKPTGKHVTTTDKP